MHGIEAWIHEHPYATGAIAIFAFILFYLMTRGGGSSSNANSVASNAMAASLQEQQLQAQSNAAQSQVAASEYQTQAQAQLGSQQVNAQLSAQNESTDAALIAALAQNQTTAQSNVLGAGVYNNELSTELAATTNTNNTELAALENTNATQLGAYTANVNAQNYLAQLQAGVYGTALNDQTAVQELGITTQGGINSQIVNEVGKAGLNHGTASLENSLTSILESAMGNVPGSVSANSANYGSGYASSAGLGVSNILNAVANIGKQVVSGIQAFTG